MTKPATEVALRGDPSPLRWLIGVELARYRNSAHLSLTEASQLSGIGRAKLGHLETGRQQQDPHDIARLLADYGAEQDDIDRLTSLTNQADEARWWAPWAQVVPDWLKTFVGLEGLAESEFVFEPMLIPGLLQTEQYAAAVTANTPRVRADYSERFVGLRIARTRRLTDTERPLQLHAVITESALRLAVGDPELRRAQLRHLLAMARLPTVTIQIVRPEDGPHTALTGQFVVLGFANVRSIGYVELHDGAVYLQDAEEVRSYTMVAEDLQRVALDPNGSISFIQSVVGE
ncbi:MAG: helix-turn-helix domain-containing protein [Actinomycetota bacterium]|nr:helix-turn-helix domain-containing protein [Actinomycetota bacterium]